MFYGEKIEIKAFNTRDGAILKPLRQLGIDVLFMTGRESEAVTRRAADLCVAAIQGVDDKAAVLKAWLDERGIAPEHCAYVGDDLNDYVAMSLCAFKACPADAALEIRSICDYISPYNGGHGAVRDICEYILKQEKKYDDFLNYWKVE